MAANDHIIAELDQPRDVFNNLTINERRQMLLANVKNLQSRIEAWMSVSKFQEEVKLISEVLPEDEEPGDVRFRRITKIMSLMCPIFIEVAKYSTGFRWVNQNNQVILAKYFIHEMTIVWMATCYDAETDSIILPDKEEYIRESFILAGLGGIANDLLDFALTMHRKNISSTELSYLYMLSLFGEEKVGLTLVGQETVRFCLEEYTSSFEDYMATEYGPKASDRIVELLEIPTKAKAISNKYRDILNEKHRDKGLPPIFKEIWILR